MLINLGLSRLPVTIVPLIFNSSFSLIVITPLGRDSAPVIVRFDKFVILKLLILTLQVAGYAAHVLIRDDNPYDTIEDIDDTPPLCLAIPKLNSGASIILIPSLYNISLFTFN